LGSTGEKELKTLSGQFFDVVSSVAFSPDGKTLASGHENETIRPWDIASGREINASLAIEVRSKNLETFFRITTVVYEAAGVGLVVEREGSSSLKRSTRAI